MAIIHFRYSTGIEAPIRATSEHGPFHFHQPASYDGIKVNIELSRSGDMLTSSAVTTISDQLASKFASISQPDHMSARDQKELRALFSSLPTAHRRILALIVQELRIYESHVLTGGRMSEWSLDGVRWFSMPGKGFMTNIRIHPRHKLDSKWQDRIQRLLDSTEEPLIATEHLHEAQRLRGDRFSWIEATVAAELAIKEALVRLNPALEVLLLEVPSPPLRKLYGTVLEAASGEKSPYVSQLSKGAEKRNHLVHRPRAIEFGAQEVVDYIGAVENAISHLLKLCRAQKGRDSKAP
jgi:hypothetical protein